MPPTGPLGELLRRQAGRHRLKRFAGAPSLRGERQPDERLHEVHFRLAALGVGEAEIVLGDLVATLGLRPQGGELGRVGLRDDLRFR
jgi:hypothetical protein